MGVPASRPKLLEQSDLSCKRDFEKPNATTQAWRNVGLVKSGHSNSYNIQAD